MNTKTDTGNETGVSRFPGPVTAAQPRSFSRRLKQLKHWVKASLYSHEKRTATLRVYRQNRID